MLRALLLALVLSTLVAGVAPTVAATHYVDCDVSHNQTVNDVYCAPHRTWDCLSMNSYKQWIGCLKG